MKPGTLWPVALAGVLGVTVLANIWMLHSATDQNAAVVEPDYYRKALKYDSTLAQQQASMNLHWQLELQAQPVSPAGQSELRLRLVQSGGAAVEGAIVRVTAIHNLDAAHRPQAQLGETEPGIYTGLIELKRPGFWELRIDAQHGDDHYTKSVRRDVGFAPRGNTEGGS